MKYSYLFLWCCTVWFANTATAQTCANSSQRYKKQVFSRINVTRDIVYERADKYDPLNINFPVDIKLDFYEPANDPLQKRPLFIFFFGGAFEIGAKGDADVVAYCDSLARHGYCCAAVDYRLGFNIASTASAIRAVYRAVQDSRASVRFFKEKWNTYKIDTTQIYMGGESAGAITALHTAYMTNDVNTPNEIHGSLTEWQDLGCLDCTGDYKKHKVDVRGVVSLWGAVYSLGYMNAQTSVPVAMIHGTSDFIVPYDQGRPFTGSLPSTFPWVYGSVQMNARLNQLGTYHEFYPYQGLSHVFYGLPTGIVTFPNQYWAGVFAKSRDFLYKVMQHQTATPAGNLVAAFGSTATYSVPLKTGSAYCWSVTGGTVLTYSNSSASASIRWNVSGTRSITLTETDAKLMQGKPATVTISSTARRNTLAVADSANSFTAFPNPLRSGENINLNIGVSETNNATIIIYDWLGKTVHTTTQTLTKGDNHLELTTDSLSNGAYIIRLQTADRNEAVKVVIGE